MILQSVCRPDGGTSNQEAGLSGCSGPDARVQQQGSGPTEPAGASRPARKFQHHAYQQAKQRQQEAAEAAEAQHQAQQQASIGEADASSGELGGHAKVAPATCAVQRQ